MIENLKKHLGKKVTMVDLFCGAGIGAVGFKLAGIETLWAVDNNKHAVNTYRHNIGDHVTLQDIRKCLLSDIPNADIISGGFPCQPFSLSGKGEGVDCKEKGDLGRVFLNIVSEKQPKLFFLENVQGLTTKRHRGFFDELVGAFADAGYDITWEITNCWDYGVPQLRKRVFVVGVRKDLNHPFVFPEKIADPEHKSCIRDAIGDLPEPYDYPQEKNSDLKNHYGHGIRNDELPFVDKVKVGGNWKDLPECDQRTFLGGAYNSGGGRTGFLRKISFDRPAYTITSVMDGKNNAQILDNADKYKNHYHSEEGYSSNYRSRNRQKQWDEPSFTIVSSSRHLPLYPDPPNYDIRLMDDLPLPPPRRFTVRECLRLQSVPDWFYFEDTVPLRKQYERCSGIPSLVAYKFGVAFIDIIQASMKNENV
jgi:DNA (cytosine-5)-methyltransferase 1